MVVNVLVRLRKPDILLVELVKLSVNCFDAVFVNVGNNAGNGVVEEVFVVAKNAPGLYWSVVVLVSLAVPVPLVVPIDDVIVCFKGFIVVVCVTELLELDGDVVAVKVISPFSLCVIDLVPEEVYVVPSGRVVVVVPVVVLYR